MIVVFPVVWIYYPSVRKVQSAFSQTACGMCQSEANDLTSGNPKIRAASWLKVERQERAEILQGWQNQCVFKGSGNQCHACMERVISVCLRFAHDRCRRHLRLLEGSRASESCWLKVSSLLPACPSTQILQKVPTHKHFVTSHCQSDIPDGSWFSWTPFFSPPPPLTPAGSENGSNAEANFTSAQREVVCGCINSQDIHACNQKLERSNDLGVRWHGNLSKAQHLSAITHVVPVAYLHTVQMHNPDIMPRHYAVRARVTVCGFVWSLYGALSETIEYFKM